MSETARRLVADTGRRKPADAAGRLGVLARLGRLPFHPFLFAAASVLSLFASNLRETFPLDVVPTLAVVLAATLAVYLVLAAAFRAFSPAAAISASLVLLAGLNYADLFGSLNRWLDGGYPMLAPLPLVLLALAAAIWLADRLGDRLAGPHLILNAVAAVMLAVPAAQAAIYQWETAGTGQMPPDPAYEAAISVAARSDAPPDIYYLMFDRYASADILREQFSYDDSGLMEFLKERGFYVAEDSASNYFKTAYSVASTLRMDYLNALAGDPELSPGNWRPIYRLLDDHRLGRFLKSRGYRLVQYSSWWKGTQHASIADESESFGFDEFAMIYARRTMARPVLYTVLSDTRLGQELAWDNGQCQRVPRKIARIKELSQTSGQEGPIFLYAHFLVPHGPHVFTEDGSCLTPGQNKVRGEQRGYLDQVAYAGKIIRDLVTHLQSLPGPKPVIIVQADEGPFPERPNVSWREATADQIRIKTGILNAYFFPDGGYSALSPDITPVNSFRVVLDKYFGTGLGRLPDRVYGTPDVFNLYDFFDVTSVVRERRG